MANLYYVQPILFKIADTFDVSFEKASSVATMQQVCFEPPAITSSFTRSQLTPSSAGYAAGLLILCPLGDTFRRRPYILALVMFTAMMVSFHLMITGQIDEWANYRAHVVARLVPHTTL